MRALHPDGIDHNRDTLTGLPGRDAARARLAEWLRAGGTAHAMLLGLRRFDAVNLAYGTPAGDAALAEVAGRLRHFAADALDGPWLSARGSGGQFLLLSGESCSRERWQFLAGQLADAVARPIAGANATVRLSPRVAMLRGLEGESADSMLDRLGQTLSRLMAESGRRLQWADGEAVRGGRSQAQLESDLLGAIDRDEIEILFQPQFACANDRLLGAEALARWNHPELGRIGAGTLFAVAERTDHVAQLSRHIADRALAAAASWTEGLRLSLNVTPSDLAGPSFAEDFAVLVGRSGFPAEQVTLEVTEQVLLADVPLAAESFDRLSAHGIRFALDDFGAGFCNFRYLKLLPLHYLKLDRSMLEGIAYDARDLAVLRGIIAMAKALGLKVIAEGVENEAQHQIARAEGCDVYQGFLRAAPMSAAEFIELSRA